MKNETTLTRVDLCQGHPEVRGRQGISNWQLIISSSDLFANEES